jgi:hypothetical protein
MTERDSLDPRLIDADARRHGEAHRDERASSSLLLQWSGLLLAPATFFAHLQIAYVLVPWDCAGGSHFWIHLVGFLSVVLAALGTFAAWTVWMREGGGDPTQHGGAIPRARFLGAVGVGTSALFVLLLAAQWAAAFILSPCQ